MAGSFIKTDIINEYYGEKVDAFAVYIVNDKLCYLLLMVYLAIKLPPNDWWSFESGSLGIRNHVSNMQVAFAKLWGGIIMGLMNYGTRIVDFYWIKSMVALGQQETWNAQWIDNLLMFLYLS